ncbi:uncharacterized protein TNCV_600811 [Trichonephila clavipes]|nr:uncharacterized protein TNCV_600811 [Trichonephila clavipes]
MDKQISAPRNNCGIETKLGMKAKSPYGKEEICKCLEIRRDCALRIAGRGGSMSFSVEYKTGNQNLFECVESFTRQELRKTCHYAIFDDNMSSCRSLRGGQTSA